MFRFGIRLFGQRGSNIAALCCHGGIAYSTPKQICAPKTGFLSSEHIFFVPAQMNLLVWVLLLLRDGHLNEKFKVALIKF